VTEDVTPAVLRGSVVQDLLRSASTGAPPLGHLIGLHRASAGSTGYALALDPTRPAMTGGAGLLESTMLADLALGGVIRIRVGLAVQIPTISLTIQLDPARVSEVVWANGECSAQMERTASARSRLHTAAGDVVGDATGVFAVPRLPYRGPGRAMPWDTWPDEDTPRPGTEAPDSSAVATVDEAVVAEVAAHAQSSPALAWGTSHVTRQTKAGSDGITFAPTAVMANRLGHVQGGALFTTSVLAVAATGNFAADTLVTGTIEFLEPANLQAPLVPQVSVIKSSGRSLFADVRLKQADRICCHISTVFRR
jgi:acyl-coenzyme A thioesterase PaaI-like protein